MCKLHSARRLVTVFTKWSTNMRATILALAAAAVFAGVCDSVWASYGIYIGKKVTADGSVFLAGYGDEPSSHWLEVDITAIRKL